MIGVLSFSVWLYFKNDHAGEKENLTLTWSKEDNKNKWKKNWVTFMKITFKDGVMFKEWIKVT